MTPSSPAPPPQPIDPESSLRSGLVALPNGPHLHGWLSEPSLLHRLTAAVNLISEGDSPRPVLGFLALRPAFAVAPRGDGEVESPQSAHRFDTLAHAVTSLSPSGAAKLYPFAQSALAEMAPKGRRSLAISTPTPLWRRYHLPRRHSFVWGATMPEPFSRGSARSRRYSHGALPDRGDWISFNL